MMSSHPDNKNSTDAKPLQRFVRAKQSTLDKTLLPVSELVVDKPTVLRYVDLKGAEQELDYRHLTQYDPMPIPMPIDREGYGSVENSPHYWASGHGDWLNVSEAIERYVQLDDKNNARLQLLDFGCATGRFLRHAWTFGSKKIDTWGCDFAPPNVQWAKKYLSPDIKIFLNTDVPHLPFPDEYFDVVTAFSVFTHIDMLEDAWLLELRRITNHNGILYLTIHNEATWKKVTTRPGSLTRMMRANDVPGNIEVSEELFKGPMPQDRLVLRMSNDNIYNSNVMFTSDYVHKNWSRYFEIMDIADNAHACFQSPVIMRPLPKTQKTSKAATR